MIVTRSLRIRGHVQGVGFRMYLQREAEARGVSGWVRNRADDSVEEAIRTMKDHAVRRLPVIDGHSLVGMVSQADIARNLPDRKIGDLVEAISS